MYGLLTEQSSLKARASRVLPVNNGFIAPCIDHFLIGVHCFVAIYMCLAPLKAAGAAEILEDAFWPPLLLLLHPSL